MLTTIQSPQKYNISTELETLLIKEKADQKIIRHDLLFKKLLEVYFEQFLEAFYPSLFKLIDFSHVHYLSEEYILDPPRRKRYIADIVLEVGLKETKEKIIIHLEPQSYAESHFNHRILLYHAMLRKKYKLPVASVAIYSYESPQNINTLIDQTLPKQQINFNYLTVHLQSKYWRNFVHQENIVSATFMCLMKHDSGDRVDLKLEFLRILHETKRAIQTSELFLLYDFFETYFQLTEKEEEKLTMKIEKHGRIFDLSKLPISFIERAEKKGEQTEKERIALNMLQDELSLSQIEKYTNLSKDDIEKIKKRELKNQSKSDK